MHESAEEFLRSGRYVEQIVEGELTPDLANAMSEVRELARQQMPLNNYPGADLPFLFSSIVWNHAAEDLSLNEEL